MVNILLKSPVSVLWAEPAPELNGLLLAKYPTPSLCFNGHFPGEPRLTSTRMSPIGILLELRMMEVVVTVAATRRAKLQSECHHQQTNTQFLQDGCPSCRPTNSVRALKGEARNPTLQKICFKNLSTTPLKIKPPNINTVVVNNH